MPSITLKNLKRINGQFGACGEVTLGDEFSNDPDLLPSPIQSSEPS